MDLFFKLKIAIKLRLTSCREKLSMRFPIALLSLFSITAFAQDALFQQKAERLYKTGVELMAQNQFAAARENFNQYLNLNPPVSNQRQDAEYSRAICSLNLYHADAEKQVQDFIDNNPSSAKASAAYADLATFYYNEKNYKKAVVYFAKADIGALTASEQNTARFRWGYCLFSQKILKEALDQFNYIKASGGQYGPAASYYAGFAEYNSADYVNALTDLKRAEQTDAYANIVPFMIANVYYKQKEYDALQAYIQSISEKKELAIAEEIALLSAEAYYKKGDYRNALAGYDKYLEGKEATANKSVSLRAGYSAFVLNDDKKALTYLKNSFADNDSVGFYSSYYLGYLYLRNNQKPMAAASFNIARGFKPDQKLVEEASFQFAKLSYDLGKSDQAITEFENILKRFPNSVHTFEIKELLSQAYVNANNYNKAIDYIESLGNRSEGVERAYQKATMLKGMELFNQESYQLAVQYFEKSLQHPSEKNYVAETSFWNGEAYSIGRKFEQAATNYGRVIQEGEENPSLVLKARYGLGYAYFNLQQYDRALFSFKEFVSKSSNRQPNLADGTLRLADCYFVSKQYSDALTYYKRAIALNSVDNDYAHFQAGNILGIQRKYSEARNELSQVIKNYAASRFLDQARFQLAQLEFEQGNYEEAKNGYTAVLTSNPSSPFAPLSYVRRAAAYYNLKEYDKTVQDYVTVIENYPTHPATKEVLLPLQEALNLSNRSGEFDKYLALAKKNIPDAKGIETVELEAAKNLYFDQQYATAIKNFDTFITSYPQSVNLSEAKYYQAESYYRLKDAKALAIYYELNVDKNFSMAGKVTGRIAELEFKQTHYEKAIPFFMTLAREAANKKEQYNAWSGLMESYYALAKFDSVEKYAKVILEKGSVNAGAQNRASLYLGKASVGKGDVEAAKDEFLNTINAAQDEYGAEAKYRLAEIFYNSKDYKQCNETLFSLNSDFASYTEWVGKSYLLLADSYLAMGDSYQAKATLRSLIDNFPLDEIKNSASAKLKKIDDEELKKRPKTDTLSNDKN
jgi:TolA-binding protein